MSKKKICIMLIGLMLTVGAVAGGIYLYNKSQEDINPTGLSGYILGEGVDPTLTPEELKALLQKQVDDSKVAFSIYSEPTFNGKKGNIMFVNPKYSAHNLDLVVKQGGKTIIRTEKISPNQYIGEIELLGKALKKGKHKAEAEITAYNQMTGELVGKVSVEMLITSE
ncbi:hypothetical protein [uncultured Clostridium sp.]|uniref:hypothetical protein n=1 Tax=uncultured Clostridium sp. TaxID=59620 RepID=UPI0025FA8055|nr:hypothetical protein [uncultured Clostridium sp.]